MEIVYLALGSNLGDRKSLLDAAIDAIKDKCGRVIDISPYYETEPVGFDSSDLFINACVKIETELAPQELLAKTQEIESELGRVRYNDDQYHSRTLDIDIIFFGNLVLSEDELRIPHRSFRGRDFVLRPLNDIAPKVIDPETKKSVEELFRSL